MSQTPVPPLAALGGEVILQPFPGTFLAPAADRRQLVVLVPLGRAGLQPAPTRSLLWGRTVARG